MPEPGWEERRETRLTNLQKLFPEAEGLRSVVEALVGAEADDAYARGLIAGRSQAGYGTRRKKKEGPCSSSPSAPDAEGSTPASAPGDEP